MLAIYCFFFNDTATTEIYTLSLHDALPICPADPHPGDAVLLPDRLHTGGQRAAVGSRAARAEPLQPEDRKSTRLNSSHANISYAVFCLKKTKICSCIRSSCSFSFFFPPLPF